MNYINQLPFHCLFDYQTERFDPHRAMFSVHCLYIWFGYSTYRLESTEWSRSIPFLTHVMFYLSKNKWLWNKKTKKQCYIKCWKCPSHFAMHAFTLFLMFDATWWSVLVSRKQYTRRYIVGLFGTGESGNVSQNSSGMLSKNEMLGSFRQWTLFAFVKNTFLHFDCWKTTDGLARAGYMTWRGLTVILCVLIQSKCIDLQPSINILIWVAWLFDHHVVSHNC
jgi:hypothetical protein